MYHTNTNKFLVILLFLGILSPTISKSKENTACLSDNRPCILEQMLRNAESIDRQAWKDQALREIAKTYAFDNNYDRAISIIASIKTPDTKAMTIRGIGMTLAHQGVQGDRQDNIFTSLRMEAEKIDHKASYAIALTYIAMSQAFANDNKGAWKTASEIENNALRHKAYGETAEIQAENGDFLSAKISIEKIETIAFRNKSYAIISRILSDSGLFEDSYEAANAITNPYKKSKSLQYLLDAQKPRDVK